MYTLKELGLTAGKTFYMTEFDNVGLIDAGSPLRRGCAQMEPTILAHIAAFVRLLRDPYYVRTLKAHLAERNIVGDYLFDWISSHLAALYGDLLTVNRTGVDFQKRLRETSRGAHPEWFLAATQRSGSFHLGQAKHARPVILTTLTALARAHYLTGLLTDNQADLYCHDGGKVFGSLYGTPVWPADVPRNLERLNEISKNHCGIPLMDVDLFVESGADNLLSQLLASKMLPGEPISDHFYKVAGLMWGEDRKALRIPWREEDRDRFNAWRIAYSTSATEDMFEVSLRGRR